MKRTTLVLVLGLLAGGCSNSASATAPAFSPSPGVSPSPTMSPAPPPTASVPPPAAPSAGASGTPSLTPASSPTPGPSPSGSASPGASPTAGSVGTMPTGFALPGKLPASASLGNLQPCLVDQPLDHAGLAKRTASRMSRDEAADRVLGNGGMVFATVDDARAFMRDAIEKSKRCATLKTRGGAALEASRQAPSNGAWERSVFTVSRVPAATGRDTSSMASLIVRRGEKVAVYQWQGKGDVAPARPSQEAVASVSAILKALG